MKSVLQVEGDQHGDRGSGSRESEGDEGRAHQGGQAEESQGYEGVGGSPLCYEEGPEERHGAPNGRQGERRAKTRLLDAREP